MESTLSGNKKSHQNLEVWQVAMQLVKTVYQLTEAFPQEERYGLSQQIRRAAVSIPSNIAEGAARGHAKEYAQFVNIARGSLAEIDTQLRVAVMLGYTTPGHQAFQLADRTGKLLTGLYRKWSTV